MTDLVTIPKHYMNKELCYAMLEFDFLERKLQNWTSIVIPIPADRILDTRYQFFQKSAGESAFAQMTRKLDCFRFPNLSYQPMGTAVSSRILRLDTDFPLLRPLLQQFPGEVIVAGGALALRKGWYVGSDNHYIKKRDVDIFFIGCTKERIDEIIKWFFAQVEKEVEKAGVVYGNKRKLWFARNRLTTTVAHRLVSSNGEDIPHLADTASQCVYQFVHSRSYKSVMHVIGGFDLGPSMIAYDGDHLIYNAMGYFCEVHKCILIDPSRRSTTYESRIEKYINRGYSLIVPGTHLSTINRKYNKREKQRLIPKLKYNFQLVKGLTLQIGGNYDFHYQARNTTTFQGKSDYGTGSFNSYQCNMYNAIHLVRQEPDLIMWQGNNIADLNNPNPRFVISTALSVDAQYLNPAHIFTYFGEEGGIEYMKQNGIYDQYLELIESQNASGGNVGSIFPKEVRTQFKANIDEILASGPESYREYIKEHGMIYIGPNQNPGRQHTSSFNPVYGDVREYYNMKIMTIRKVGITDEIYWLLKMAMKKYLHYVYKDMLKLILTMVAREQTNAYQDWFFDRDRN